VLPKHIDCGGRYTEQRRTHFNGFVVTNIRRKGERETETKTRGRTWITDVARMGRMKCMHCENDVTRKENIQSNFALNEAAGLDRPFALACGLLLLACWGNMSRCAARTAFRGQCSGTRP
jgi:hypothetical protein